MRVLTTLVVIIGMLAVLFRWRYRILNMILAITVLRKLFVFLSMKVPTLRNKLSPLFLSKSNNESSL